MKKAIRSKQKYKKKSDRAYVIENLPSENSRGGCFARQSNVALLPRSLVERL